MEHKGTAQYLLRRSRSSLQQIIVVGIHTGNHILTQSEFVAILLTFKEVHQHRLLPSRQVHLRREHDLEVSLVVLELRQHSPPEIDIIVTLDVGNNPAPCLFRGQCVGCLKIARIDIVFKIARHIDE